MGVLPPFLLCVDFGSTFTKVALVDTAQGTVVATAQHRTTIDSDVLDGLAACRDQIRADHPEVHDAVTIAASSAGGGLRIAVVGNEELVTAEAGRRVALSSGGKVVEVLAGGLDTGRLAELQASAPDVLLLVGGTDGGNAETLLADAAVLAANDWNAPVVVAGDVQAQQEVARLLGEAGTPYRLAGNVVPKIGVLAPESARRAMREVFLEHVIGGKHLSADPAFAAMVLGPTPDVVLLGVELLAAEHGGSAPGAGVLVVDVGGATTDVHSVVVADPETSSLGREVVADSTVTRTVEGDLGMRWSAETTAAFAVDDRLVEGARLRTSDPGFLATTEAELGIDRALAEVAARVAVRRHAGRSRVVFSSDGKVVERSGKDVRGIELLVGSGGVFRAASDDVVAGILGAATGPDPEGWQVPDAPRIVVDRASVLAAVGLLVLYGEREGLAEQAAVVARDLVCTSVIGTETGRSTR